MEFSRQDHWNGLPLPSPRDLPDPGIQSMSPAAPALRADSLPLSHRGSPQMFYFTTTKISKEEGYFMPLS